MVSKMPLFGYLGSNTPQPNRENVANSNGTMPRILRGTGQCAVRNRSVELAAVFAENWAQSKADLPADMNEMNAV